MKSRILFWLVCNVPLGPLAPYMLAWALGSRAVKVSD